MITKRENSESKAELVRACHIKELFALKEDFAKVAIIVQIIRFPHLNKPNFRRLCHYCATNSSPKCTNKGTKIMCANNYTLHTSLIFNNLERNKPLVFILVEV